MNTYVIKEFYENYVFIHSYITQKEFDYLYYKFFHSLTINQMMDIDNIVIIKNDDCQVISQIFDGKEIIKHSIGSMVNSQLIIHQGPLIGLENNLERINKSKRIAFLNCEIFENMMKVPLEIVK